MSAALTVPEISRPSTTKVEDRILCHCESVTESTVRAAVESGDASSLEEVVACTGAGSGCRGCHCRIHRVLMGLPARCGGRFDLCSSCGCAGAICRCDGA